MLSYGGNYVTHIDREMYFHILPEEDISNIRLLPGNEK
jgi:hypothetical protein